MANKKTVSAKALTYLKYDKERVAPGGVFKVRVSDAAEFAKKGYIEIIENTNESEKPDGQDDENDKDDEKEGE